MSQAGRGAGRTALGTSLSSKSSSSSGLFQLDIVARSPQFASPSGQSGGAGVTDSVAPPRNFFLSQDEVDAQTREASTREGSQADTHRSLQLVSPVRQP